VLLNVANYPEAPRHDVGRIDRKSSEFRQTHAIIVEIVRANPENLKLLSEYLHIFMYYTKIRVKILFKEYFWEFDFSITCSLQIEICKIYFLNF